MCKMKKLRVNARKSKVIIFEWARKLVINFAKSYIEQRV